MFEVLETEAVRHLASLAPEDRDRMVRFCARLSGDAHAAEDLAQETLVEAWRHLHALKSPDVCQSWLFGIARNVCLRARRRAGREAVRHALSFDEQAECAVVDQTAGDFDVEIE